MHLFSALLLGFATNLDNLMLGVSFGLQGKKMRAISNLVIALGSAAASYLCCFLAAGGHALGRSANVLGGVLLIAVAVFPLLPRRGGQAGEPGAAGQPVPADGPAQAVGCRQTVVLAAALALNCLAPSFAAGLTGLSPAWLALAAGGFSFAAVGAGNLLGRRLHARLNTALLNLAAALVMALVGVWEMFH